MRKLALLFMPWLLAGCQATGGTSAGAASGVPLANSRLVLNQALEIPAGTAHTTLQGGRVVDGRQYNRYHTYCSIEVRRVSEQPQPISPDDFLIRRAYQETQQGRVDGLMRVARGGLGSGGSTHFVFRTVFDLSSPRQPDVRWMFCEQWGDPALGAHPTLEEIRNALGSYFTLKPPATDRGPS